MDNNPLKNRVGRCRDSKAVAVQLLRGFILDQDRHESAVTGSLRGASGRAQRRPSTEPLQQHAAWHGSEGKGH